MMTSHSYASSFANKVKDVWLDRFPWLRWMTLGQLINIIDNLPKALRDFVLWGEYDNFPKIIQSQWRKAAYIYREYEDKMFLSSITLGDCGHLED